MSECTQRDVIRQMQDQMSKQNGEQYGRLNTIDQKMAVVVPAKDAPMNGTHAGRIKDLEEAMKKLATKEDIGEVAGEIEKVSKEIAKSRANRKDWLRWAAPLLSVAAFKALDFII